MKVLAENEFIKVFYEPRDSDTAIVSFSHIGFHRAFPYYWGASVFEKLGYSAVGVVCKQDRWFPAKAVRDCLASMDRPWLSHQHIVAYGCSMGGYGCLRHGASFGANYALALSPQATIDPGFLRGRDMRFVHYFDPAIQSEMEIRSATAPRKSFVFYDPIFELDALNVKWIVDVCPSIQTVKLKHLGHDTVQAFASSSAFRSICDAIKHGDPFSVASKAARAKRASVRRAFGLAENLLNDRPALADAIMKKYLDTMPDHLQVRWAELEAHSLSLRPSIVSSGTCQTELGPARR